MTETIADAAARLYALQAQLLPLNQRLVAAVVEHQDRVATLYRDAGLPVPEELLELDRIDSDRSTDYQIWWEITLSAGRGVISGSVMVEELANPGLAILNARPKIEHLTQMKALETAERELGWRRQSLVDRISDVNGHGSRVEKNHRRGQAVAARSRDTARTPHRADPQVPRMTQA